MDSENPGEQRAREHCVVGSGKWCSCVETGAIPAMNDHMVAIGVDDPVLTHAAAIEQFLRRPDDDDARAGPAGFPA